VSTVVGERRLSDPLDVTREGLDTTMTGFDEGQDDTT